MTARGKLPAVLTIAGSDSGGGAGIQADLRTFNAFKVYGCSAITAVTSQNPNEVRRVDVLSGDAVKCQLETILAAFPVRFAKSGMLVNREIIGCVAEIISQKRIALVVDPVMVSTSGTRLLEQSAIAAMKELLFPQAAWLTPNIPEAELICNKKISTRSDIADAAKMLYEKFGCSIILKGGHFTNGSCASDIICHEGELFTLVSPEINIPGNTAHGTGCTLSAALAANLALGKNWQSSVIAAKAFVYGSLAENVLLSDSLRQMYPPEQSFHDQISLY